MSLRLNCGQLLVNAETGLVEWLEVARASATSCDPRPRATASYNVEAVICTVCEVPFISETVARQDFSAINEKIAYSPYLRHV